MSAVTPSPWLSKVSVPDDTTARLPVGGHDVICQDTDWPASNPNPSR
jgi:hypothetical protein